MNIELNCIFFMNQSIKIGFSSAQDKILDKNLNSSL